MTEQVNATRFTGQGTRDDEKCGQKFFTRTDSVGIHCLIFSEHSAYGYGQSDLEFIPSVPGSERIISAHVVWHYPRRFSICRGSGMKDRQHSIPMDLERRYRYKQPCLQKDNASGGGNLYIRNKMKVLGLFYTQNENQQTRISSHRRSNTENHVIQ